MDENNTNDNSKLEIILSKYRETGFLDPIDMAELAAEIYKDPHTNIEILRQIEKNTLGELQVGKDAIQSISIDSENDDGEN